MDWHEVTCRGDAQWSFVTCTVSGGRMGEGSVYEPVPVIWASSWAGHETRLKLSAVSSICYEVFHLFLNCRVHP